MHRVSSETDSSWSAGDWVLIRFTWDWTGPAGTRNVHLYLDGVEVPVIPALASKGPAVFPDESTSDYVWLGNRGSMSGFTANGLIEDVRIWDRPLSP